MPIIKQFHDDNDDKDKTLERLQNEIAFKDKTLDLLTNVFAFKDKKTKFTAK